MKIWDGEWEGGMERKKEEIDGGISTYTMGGRMIEKERE